MSTDQVTVRVKCSEEEWIVACLCELGARYAQVDSVRSIADKLRAERGLTRAQVLDYLSRFEAECAAVEPVLLPAIEHMKSHIARARNAAGIDRPQVQA